MLMYSTFNILILLRSIQHWKNTPSVLPITKFTHTTVRNLQHCEVLSSVQYEKQMPCNATCNFNQNKIIVTSASPDVGWVTLFLLEHATLASIKVQQSRAIPNTNQLIREFNNRTSENSSHTYRKVKTYQTHYYITTFITSGLPSLCQFFLLLAHF